MTPERPQPTREQLALCAHDLRGVLTVISGYVDMLRRDDLTGGERQQALDGIADAVKRADRLLGDTLAGKTQRPAHAERVDLAAVAEQAATDARIAFDRDIRVVVAGAPSVDDDTVAMSRVIENLLTNAAKYAPTGPIELRLTENDGLVVIEVADRGPGVPAEERERILEPFARLERDIDAPGTGLGLTVVRSVAERAGGRVEVHERDGGGTVMRVELPAASG